jgi:hypothetical protein
MSHTAAVAFVLATARTGMMLQLERRGAGADLGADLVAACLRGMGVEGDRAVALARQAAAAGG